MKMMFHIMDTKEEIKNMTKNNFTNLIKKPTEKELQDPSASLLALTKAEPTDEAYDTYVEMFLTKIRDRFNKSFFTYYRAQPDSDEYLNHMYALVFKIEPEDMETMIAMNALFIRNNLDKKEAEKRFFKKLPEFLSLEGVKVIYLPDEKENTISGVTSIVDDKTLFAQIYFIENEKYGWWLTQFQEAKEKRSAE